MKTPLLVAFLLLVVSATAQSSFPGLKSVLTQAEWERAGLDRLTPDQIGVIDAALIRHQNGANAQVQAEIARIRSEAAPTSPASPG